MIQIQLVSTEEVHVEATNEQVSPSGPSQNLMVEPEKQNTVKTSMPPSQVSKAVPDDVMFAEIAKLELDNLHSFYNCKHKSCNEFSGEEEARQKLLKKRMCHSWLEEKDLTYCKATRIWWKHKTLNTQNSATVFSITPSTRYRKEDLREHAATKMHKAAIETEMNQRVSPFHAQYEKKTAVRNRSFSMPLPPCTGWLKRQLPMPSFTHC